jgi:hypothetical protein
MITFADLGPTPTVHLFLRVPVPLAAGGWTWGELPPYAGVLAREYVYSQRECEAVVNAYGRIIGTVGQQQKCLGDRYSVMAKGPVTGLVLGLREWVWSAVERAYVHAGEYLCGFRRGARAYWEATGTLIERQTFSASVVAPSVIIPGRALPLANLRAA